MQCRNGRVLGLILAVGWAAAARSDGGVNRWTRIGPDGGVITALAVGAGAHPVVYAGTHAGVFRSVDEGASWTPASEGLTSGEIDALVTDPQDPSIVYVGAGGRVFRSVDRGGHWTTGNSPSGVRALAVDPFDPSTVYAAAGRRIYRSGDSATTWDPVFTPAGSSPVTEITALAVSRTGVYGGFTTRRCLLSDLCFPSGGGVLRSPSGTGSWEVAGGNMPIRALAADPSNGDTLYAGGGGVFLGGKGAFLRSVDGGAHWSAIGPRGEVVSVAVDPSDPSVVYWGTYDVGVFRWNGGESPQSPVRTGALWVSVAVEAATGRAWAGTDDGVSTSPNGIDGWRFRSHGISAADLRAIAVDPTTAVVYAGTYGGVFKSADGGSTWTKYTTGLEERSTQALRLDPTDPSTIYAGTDQGVFRSTDGGETWSPPTGPEISGLFIADVAVDPRTPSVVYAMAPTGGVFRSADRGLTWSASNNGLTVTQGYSLDVDRVTSAVYAGTYGGVFRSTDGGSSWTPMNEGLTTPEVYQVRIAPGDGSILYASTGQGLFRTTDGGASWLFLGQYGVSIAIDPVDPLTVYTASFGSAIRSTDGGLTWTAPPGIPALPVVSLAMRPAGADAPARVYAATVGGGAYAISFHEIDPCVAGATTLCLQNGRFRVTLDWRTAKGRSGQGQAVPLSEESAAFWFRTPDDVELAVKILDGRSFNGNFWFFAGALSSVEYTIHVVDTFTGAEKTYFNPMGRLASFVDTSAFAYEGAMSGAADRTTGAAAPIAVSPDPADCGDAPHALCLNGSRFRVAVAWKTRSGRTGEGQAVPLTSEAGYFWFFDPANVELVVKVLDGRPLNGHFWVFYGALSSVAYTITVTDTQTGAVRTYENALGNQASVGDTQAF